MGTGVEIGQTRGGGVASPSATKEGGDTPHLKPGHTPCGEPWFGLGLGRLDVHQVGAVGQWLAVQRDLHLVLPGLQGGGGTLRRGASTWERRVMWCRVNQANCKGESEVSYPCVELLPVI